MGESVSGGHAEPQVGEEEAWMSAQPWSPSSKGGKRQCEVSERAGKQSEQGQLPGSQKDP